MGIHDRERSRGAAPGGVPVLIKARLGPVLPHLMMMMMMMLMMMMMMMLILMVMRYPCLLH